MGTPTLGSPMGPLSQEQPQWEPHTQRHPPGTKQHLLAPKNMRISQINAKFNFLSISAVKNDPRSLENRFMSNFIEKIVVFFQKSRASFL